MNWLPIDLVPVARDRIRNSLVEEFSSTKAESTVHSFRGLGLTLANKGLNE